MPGPIDWMLAKLGEMGLKDGEWNEPDYGDRPARYAEINEYRSGNTLPNSEYRPTSLTKFQDQPFKSLKQYYPEKLLIHDFIKSPEPGEIIDMNGKVDTPYPHKDFFGRNDGYIPLEGQLGLGGVGHAKLSAGRDTKGPYISAFDSWDFGSGEGHASGYSVPYGDLEAALLRRAGKPFNVYDRVYFKPNKYGDIPRTIGAPGDIELPVETKKKPIKTRR